MAAIHGLIFLLGIMFGMIFQTIASIIGSIIKKKKENDNARLKVFLEAKGGKKAIEAYEEWEEYN